MDSFCDCGNNTRMKRTFYMLAVLSSFFIVNTAGAAEWPGAERRILRLPKTDAESQTAHQEAEADAAILIAEDEKVEAVDRSEMLYFPIAKGEIEVACDRRSFITMGSQLLPEDQKKLPYFSGNTILNCVKRYYLSVQAMVARNPQGTLYLVDRARLAVAMYTDPAMTQESTELVENSAKEMRSLGMFTAASGADSPPRTLVILNRNVLAEPQPDGTEGLRPNYEFAFFHLHIDPKDATPAVHAFVTTGRRTRFHWLRQCSKPGKPEECAIEGTIFFTKYGYGGLVPLAKATRNVKLNEQAATEISQLNEWVTRRGLSGDAWDQLPVILDAVIAGELKLPAPTDVPTLGQAPTGKTR